MSGDDLARWRWLLSADGEAAIARASELLRAGEPTLRIATTLRATLDPDQAAMALTQATLRQQATGKFPQADRLLFTRDGLEQASSAVIAAHRAQRFAGQATVSDLCCGIGGDAMGLALADPGRPLRLIDRDATHLLLASHNVRTVTPTAAIDAIERDVRDQPIGPDSAIFIDPARREGGTRKRGPESEPPLDWAFALPGAVGIKAAPGIPREVVPPGWELETIALGFELKEAALWSPALAAADRSATVITAGGAAHFTGDPDTSAAFDAPQAGGWLHDPNPAITRAGLVRPFAAAHGLALIDEQIGFLVGERALTSPFVRSWPILAVLPWHEATIRRALAGLDAGPVDIRRRGLPGDVDAISRRLRGRGARPMLIGMTRVANQPTAIICDKLPAGG